MLSAKMRAGLSDRERVYGRSSIRGNPGLGNVVPLSWLPCQRAESSMGCARSGQTTNYLTAVVDAPSYFEDATGEGPEVDHHPVIKQKSMAPRPAPGVRIADHLTAVVDSPSLAEGFKGCRQR